jgi:tRNA(fMet)-specific endonuclease VapC
MALILDADVIIRSEKGLFDLYGWIASRPDDQFEIAAITVAELWHGVERASGVHQAKRRQYLQPIVAALPIIPYTEQTAYEHARIWANLESSGTMISSYDVIVAATALERGSAVATFNRRHFIQVKGLKFVEPKMNR